MSLSGPLLEVPSSRNHLAPEPVAPGIAYLTIVFVNAYFVGDPGGPWTLVDTGLPHTAAYLRHAVAARYGPKARPEAIILTHGHFDHAGSVAELAAEWNVPVYAHPLEMPYLTGRSDYPPQDPTIGGAIAFLSRFFPHSGHDFRGVVRPLPENFTVPGMPGWRWLHTPGHTAGHVSLFREADRVLLAGDAFTTMDLDSWAAQFSEQQEIDRPPAPLTTDWDAARASIDRLADLEPNVVAAGHGIPMVGPQVAAGLRRLVTQLDRPRVGRYAILPALTDETGVVALPPPVPDRLPGSLAAGAAAMALAAASSRRQSGTIRRSSIGSNGLMGGLAALGVGFLAATLLVPRKQ